MIAYSHCIAHGYDLARGAEHQRMAVDSGLWPLYRFDPRRLQSGQAPLVLDGGRTKLRVEEYMMNEARFRVVGKRSPERFAAFAARAQADAEARIEFYRQLAEIRTRTSGGE